MVAALVAAILGTDYANTTQIFRIQRRIRTEQTQPVQEIQPAMGAGGSADGSVFNDLINGDWQGTIDAVGYRLEVLQGKETYVGDAQLGHSRGVLASIVNEFESGSLLLSLLRRKPFVEFIAIIIVCGIVEYMTSWVLEILHDGAKWWDYTGYYLNLNGRICAEGLLVFGIGGMAFVYVLAPVVDNIIEQIRMKILVPVCAALLVVFGVDVVYSGFHPNQGKGVTESVEAESGEAPAESEQG